MNEADKERYFREKEAYERITGHVLPVAKVRKKRLNLAFLIYFFQVVISNPTSNSASQDSTGATRSAFVDLVGLYCSLKNIPSGALERAAIDPASGTQNGRTNTAGEGSSCKRYIVPLKSYSASYNILKTIFKVFKSQPSLPPATSAWCSTATGCSRTG